MHQCAVVMDLVTRQMYAVDMEHVLMLIPAPALQTIMDLIAIVSIAMEHHIFMLKFALGTDHAVLLIPVLAILDTLEAIVHYQFAMDLILQMHQYVVDMELVILLILVHA